MILNRPPRDLKFAIVACFYPPIVTEGPVSGFVTITTTPAGITTSTGIVPITTTGLPPTTTTMNYCTEEKGMNQPLHIIPNQVTSIPQPEQTTPPGDINPTSTTPGLNYPSPNPQISVLLDQPATLTIVYIPTDRPNQPSNVDKFDVVFVYPNGSTSETFKSEIPLEGQTTTTPPSGIPSGATTPSPSEVVPPSGVSPQVDLPSNFRVPEGTTIIFRIISTNDNSNPTGVCKR